MAELKKITLIGIPDWADKTEKRLKKYPDIVKRLAVLEIELEKQAYPSTCETTHFSETRVFNLSFKNLGIASDQEVEYRERLFEKRILDEVINRLKPELKEVVDLYYVKEYNRDKICIELHISPETYNRRRKKAISCIADWLGMKYTYDDMTQN